LCDFVSYETHISGFVCNVQQHCTAPVCLCSPTFKTAASSDIIVINNKDH